MQAAKATRVRFRSTYRIVSSRFPPVGVFDTIADPADIEALHELEALTNPRMRDALGAIELGSSVLWLSRHATVPVLVVQDRVHGPYQAVMVASDLAPASATALQLADAWFGDTDRHELLHAFEVPLHTHVGSKPQRDAILHGLQADAEDAVDAFVRQTLDERRAGHWQLTAAPAHPVRLLRQHAMTRPGTLAVIASHGRSALADRLVGSVAKRLLETAACDMLVVRSGKA